MPRPFARAGFFRKFEYNKITYVPARCSHIAPSERGLTEGLFVTQTTTRPFVAQRATPPAHSRRLKRMLFSFLEKEKQHKRKIFLSTRPMRASVVCDSRFTQIRAKVCSPSDIGRCIPIPDVQATTLAARLFRSAFGAKGPCGSGGWRMLTEKFA